MENHKKEIGAFNVEDAIKNLEVDPKFPLDYANYVHFLAGQYDITIDFFHLATDVSNMEILNPQLVRRVVIPISMAKGFVTAMANSIVLLEEGTGLEVPLLREPNPNDKIKIW